MLAWFDKLFPQAPDNPLFAEEVQTIKGPRTPKALLGYTLLVSYFIGALVVAWYVVPEGSHTYSATKLLLAGLLVLAIVFALIADVTCTWQSMEHLPISSQEMVAARLALTEIRSWWFIGLESAFRVALVLIVLICFLNLGNWPIGGEMNAASAATQHIVTLSNQLASNPGAWGFILAMIILVVIQLLEPIWRLRTLATLNMKQAIQNPNASLATGLPNIVIVWGIALAVYLVPGLFLFVTLRNALLNSLAFGLVAYSLVVGVSIWGLYDWLESSALKQIETHTEPVKEP
jgi:hypothetical protein